MEKEQALCAYILENLNNNPQVTSLNNSEDLLNTGILDSLGVLQLITFIETQFSIAVPDTDVTLENFSSIEAIMQYLQQRQA